MKECRSAFVIGDGTINVLIMGHETIPYFNVDKVLTLDEAAKACQNIADKKKFWKLLLASE